MDILDFRGQVYDGVGAVAGKVKGLQAQIRRVNPKSLYTHCASHRLNLAVEASCKEQRIVSIGVSTPPQKHHSPLSFQVTP